MEKKKQTKNKLSYSVLGKYFRGFLCMVTFCVFCVSVILSIYAVERYGTENIGNPKDQYNETSSYQEELRREIEHVLNCCDLIRATEASNNEIAIIDVAKNEIHYYSEVSIDKDVYYNEFTGKTLEDLEVYEQREASQYRNADLMEYDQMRAYLEESESLCDYLYFDKDSFRALFERDGLQNTNHRFSDMFSEEAYFVFENYDKGMENTVEYQQDTPMENASEKQVMGSTETVIREIVITPANMDFYAVYDPEQGIYYSTYDEYFNEMDTYIYRTDSLLSYISAQEEVEGTYYNSLIIPLLRNYNYSMQEMVEDCSGIYETIPWAENTLSRCANRGIHYHFQEETDSFISNVRNIQEIESMENYYCLKKTGDDVVTQFHSDAVPDFEDLYVVKEYLEGYPVGTTFYLGFDPYTDLLWNLEASPLVRGNEEYPFFRDYTLGLLIVFIISFVLLLVQAIGLICTTGKNFKGDKEVVLNFFDRFYTEIWFLVSCGILISSVTFGVVCLEQLGISLGIVEMVCWTVAGSLVFGLCFMLLTLSFVRRIKAHNLWNQLLVVKLVKFTLNKMKDRKDTERKTTEELEDKKPSTVRDVATKIWNQCTQAYYNLTGTRKLQIVFVVYLLIEIIFVFFILTENADGYEVLALLFFLLLQWIALMVVVRVGKDIDNLTEGVREITKGNLDSKVEINEKVSVFGELAHGINHIGDGLKNAVETSLKDERMKTELITNVSHDLKTPLTSIINYIDLLKKEEIPGEDAKHYIDVLDTKSQRLKQLTEDLVEAAKATSGNIELEMMPLTFDELMKQALGEFEDKYEKRNLTIVASYPEEPAVVMADGRRLFRIIENVLQNIYKYAMEGTRVYADLSKDKGVVTFTLKNVSAAPLNISPEELMERFTRGDASRTTEGSGLGLSIAKDLTRLQNGEFEIQLDGDLFKVIIRFPEYGKTDA